MRANRRMDMADLVLAQVQRRLAIAWNPPRPVKRLIVRTANTDAVACVIIMAVAVFAVLYLWLGKLPSYGFLP